MAYIARPRTLADYYWVSRKQGPSSCGFCDPDMGCAASWDREGVRRASHVVRRSLVQSDSRLHIEFVHDQAAVRGIHREPRLCATSAQSAPNANHQRPRSNATQDHQGSGRPGREQHAGRPGAAWRRAAPGIRTAWLRIGERMRCVPSAGTIVGAVGVGACPTNVNVRELLFRGAEAAGGIG